MLFWPLAATAGELGLEPALFALSMPDAQGRAHEGVYARARLAADTEGAFWRAFVRADAELWRGAIARMSEMQTLVRTPEPNALDLERAGARGRTLWRLRLHRAEMAFFADRGELAIGRMHPVWGPGWAFALLDRLAPRAPLALEPEQTPGADGLRAFWDAGNVRLHAFAAPGRAARHVAPTTAARLEMGGVGLELAATFIRRGRRDWAGLDLQADIGETTAWLLAVRTGGGREVAFGASGARGDWDWSLEALVDGLAGRAPPEPQALVGLCRRQGFARASWHGHPLWRLEGALLASGCGDRAGWLDGRYAGGEDWEAGARLMWMRGAYGRGRLFALWWKGFF